MEDKAKEETKEDQGQKTLAQLEEIAKMVFENKEFAREIVELFQPIMSEAVDLVSDTIGPEIEKTTLRVALSVVEIRKQVMAEYLAKDFTRGEAIAFMLKDEMRLDEAPKAFK